MISKYLLLRCQYCYGSRRGTPPYYCSFCANTGVEPIPMGELFLNCPHCSFQGVEAPCRVCVEQ
jgi:DNA-directed RNA polymerase subunit RPC12/RpoP